MRWLAKTKLAMPSPSACEQRKPLCQRTPKCLYQTSTEQPFCYIVVFVGIIEVMPSPLKRCDKFENHAGILLVHSGRD